MELTPLERVERALRGEPVDKTPFTVYHGMVPRCALERRLRNMGLCVVRGMDVVTTCCPDVKCTETTYTKDGVRLVRTDYDTPFGTLTSIREPAGFTSWTREYLFSGPEDYKKLIFQIDNEQYKADYAPYIRAQEVTGGDVFLPGARLAWNPVFHMAIMIQGTRAISTVIMIRFMSTPSRTCGALSVTRLLAKRKVSSASYTG